MIFNGVNNSVLSTSIETEGKNDLWQGKPFFFFKKMLYTYIIDCWVSVCLGWGGVFLMLSSTSIEGSLTGVRPFMRWMFIYLHDGRRRPA
ncbi:hypothetical protein CRM71_00180 [Prevotella jejuni]|nr:hypothetical protein CRM71_00180 [Prevotella jejuni]